MEKFPRFEIGPRPLYQPMLLAAAAAAAAPAASVNPRILDAERDDEEQHRFVTLCVEHRLNPGPRILASSCLSATLI